MPLKPSWFRKLFGNAINKDPVLKSLNEKEAYGIEPAPYNFSDLDRCAVFFRQNGSLTPLYSVQLYKTAINLDADSKELRKQLTNAGNSHIEEKINEIDRKLKEIDFKIHREMEENLKKLSKHAAVQSVLLHHLHQTDFLFTGSKSFVHRASEKNALVQLEQRMIILTPEKNAAVSIRSVIDGFDFTSVNFQERDAQGKPKVILAANKKPSVTFDTTYRVSPTAEGKAKVTAVKHFEIFWNRDVRTFLGKSLQSLRQRFPFFGSAPRYPEPYLAQKPRVKITSRFKAGWFFRIKHRKSSQNIEVDLFRTKINQALGGFFFAADYKRLLTTLLEIKNAIPPTEQQDQAKDLERLYLYDIVEGLSAKSRKELQYAIFKIQQSLISFSAELIRQVPSSNQPENAIVSNLSDSVNILGKLLYTHQIDVRPSPKNKTIRLVKEFIQENSISTPTPSI